VGLFCSPRTFESASNFWSSDPDRFYHLPVNEDHEEQRKISAIDLLSNLIKEKTTSLILIVRNKSREEKILHGKRLVN